MINYDSRKLDALPSYQSIRAPHKVRTLRKLQVPKSHAAQTKHP